MSLGLRLVGTLAWVGLCTAGYAAQSASRTPVVLENIPSDDGPRYD